MMRRCLLALLVASAAGCAEPGTLVVVARSDLLPGLEFDGARVELLDAEGAVTREVETSFGPEDDFVEGRRVAALEQLAGRDIRLRVALTLGDREVIARPVRVQLESDAFAYTVVFTRDCRGVTCEDAGRGACLRGECVPNECTEETPCLDPECTSDGECEAPVACATGQCSEGVCLSVGSGPCPARGYCDLDRGCTDPDWPQVQVTLQEAAAQGSTSEPTFRTFAPGLEAGASSRWVGGVLAPNGRIYGMPFNVETILEIDPEAGTARTFGSFPGTNSYVGGVLGPDGFIYGIPLQANRVLRIDPEAGTAELIGPDLGGGAKFGGGVVATNGLIYCMPAGARQVGVLDPVAETLTYIGPELPDTAHKYRGAVLSPSGLVIGIPAAESRVLSVDPFSGEVRLFGDLMAGSRNWYGGVVTPDGRVLGLPLGATTVLEIDPLAETVVEHDTGATLTSSTGASGALAPNGLVYLAPSRPPRVRELDPSTLTSRELDDFGGGEGKWIGAVLGLNGRIYGIPWNSDAVLEIDPHASGVFPPWLPLSPWLDKL